MFLKLIPKQHNFFIFFQEAGDLIVTAAQQFKEMLGHLNESELYAKNIAEQESQGDNVARAAFDLLHKTFITPFDRQDIIQLIRQLDDILDMINRTAKRMAVYKIDHLPEGISEIADLVLSSAVIIKNILMQLSNLKNSPDIIQNCLKINEAETAADILKMGGVAKLFAEETDFKLLLKTKEIYDYSKLIVSECHHLANLIKGIVLEYS